MDRNNDQSPDVRLIMKRIREEMRGGGPPQGPADSGPVLADKDSYDLNELLVLDGKNFVASAYAALLKREPDQQGMDHFLAGLRSGTLSKIDVLGRLRYSSEGKARGVAMRGLGRSFALHSLMHVPVLGRLARIASGLAALPAVRAQLDAVAGDLRSVSNDKADWKHFKRLEELALALKEDAAGQAGLLGTHEARLNTQEHSVANNEERIANNEERIIGHEVRLSGLETGKAEAEAVEQGLRALKRELLAHERLLAERPARTEAAEAVSERAGKSERRERLLDAGYVNFEDAFRGPTEDVRERLSQHLPMIKNSSAIKNGLPLVDVGCGRGEWLGLLAENGIAARGVDMNAVMAEECRRAGLAAEAGDGLAYLAGLESGSLGAVTAFHVAEHLELPDLLEMFDQILRVLAPGGVAALETPNPGNVLVGSYSFYLDPTHKNPIPAPLLAYLAISRGFEKPGIRFLNPVDRSRRLPEDTLVNKRFNELFCAPQDYALYLVKT